jgi:hypothetical protein
MRFSWRFWLGPKQAPLPPGRYDATISHAVERKDGSVTFIIDSVKPKGEQ